MGAGPVPGLRGGHDLRRPDGRLVRIATGGLAAGRCATPVRRRDRRAPVSSGARVRPGRRLLPRGARAGPSAARRLGRTRLASSGCSGGGDRAGASGAGVGRRGRRRPGRAPQRFRQAPPRDRDRSRLPGRPTHARRPRHVLPPDDPPLPARAGSRSTSATARASARPTRCFPRATASRPTASTSSSAWSRRTAGPKPPSWSRGWRSSRAGRSNTAASSIDEMDVDAVLARKPQVALVDELAHTNAPGSRNPKRYQDVQEILAAGIHVISTLNVQHLESLYNTVEQLLGVKVRERVPDSVLAEADAGGEHRPGRRGPAAAAARRARSTRRSGSASALENFFTASNLEHLRELTLREVASQLDFKRREGGAAKGAPAAEDGTAEQVMVCLSSRGPNSARLLRFGSRLAGRLNRNWYAVYVQTPVGGADRHRRHHAAAAVRHAHARQPARRDGLHVQGPGRGRHDPALRPRVPRGQHRDRPAAPAALVEAPHGPPRRGRGADPPLPRASRSSWWTPRRSSPGPRNAAPAPTRPEKPRPKRHARPTGSVACSPRPRSSSGTTRLRGTRSSGPWCRRPPPRARTATPPPTPATPPTHLMLPAIPMLPIPVPPWKSCSSGRRPAPPFSTRASPCTQPACGRSPAPARPDRLRRQAGLRGAVRRMGRGAAQRQVGELAPFHQPYLENPPSEVAQKADFELRPRDALPRGAQSAPAPQPAFLRARSAGAATRPPAPELLSAPLLSLAGRTSRLQDLTGAAEANSPAT